MIDAHIHFWDRSRFRYDWLDDEPAVPEHFLPADFDEAAPGTGPVVLVQADCTSSAGLDEARWFDEIAATRPGGAAIVAFAPLESPEISGYLDALTDVPNVVGVRRLFQSEPGEFFNYPELGRDLRHESTRFAGWCEWRTSS